MTLMRVCLHSIVLTITDLGTIILAFGFYSILRSSMAVNQRVLQGSIATIFCISYLLSGAWRSPACQQKRYPCKEDVI